MRVLLITWEYPPVIEGGLARHVRKLSEHLVAAGTEVHVLTRGGGRLPVLEERHGVVLHRVSEPPFPTDVHRFLRWVRTMNRHMAALGRELMAQHDFDLVHSHDWLVADAAEAVARTAGVPWLVTIHATEYGRHQGWVQQSPQSEIHGAERAMARSSDRVIVCSRYMRGHVARVFELQTDRIDVIPNGVDPTELEPTETDLVQLRSRFAAADELLVLLVGRLVYEKGFHLALDALAPVIRRRRGVRFLVAGTGTAEQELKRQAARLELEGHGQFLGWVGDDMLHALYRISDLCIVPSIYEPFGIVALEAMASGCPCIVADTGGLREVVPDEETVGLRFPAQDAQALRVLVERLLEDDRERARLAEEARAHVVAFDWAKVARQTRTVYDSLAPQTAISGR